MPKLINWQVLPCIGSDAYFVYGKVYGHSRIVDGHNISTSKICRMKRTGTTLEIQTRNTLYQCSLSSHVLSGCWYDRSDPYETLKNCLEHFGYERKEAEALVERMKDAYDCLNEDKKRELRILLPVRSEVCTILEFSAEQEYYFRFLAWKDQSETKFWDEKSLTVYIGQEESCECLVSAGEIRCRFYACPGNRLRIFDHTENMGEVYVRNGGFAPLTVEMGEDAIVVEPGESRGQVPWL